MSSDNKVSKEKDEMQKLNNRFADYIKKIQLLEEQNKKYVAELGKLQGKGASRVGALYKDRIRELEQQVEELTEKNPEVEGQLKTLKEKLDNEELRRMKAEQDLENATIAKLHLKRKAESLKKEIIFLKELHEREIRELQTQPQQHVEVDRKMVKADFTDALKDVRLQYEKLASKNINDSKDRYKSKIDDLTKEAKSNKEALQRAEKDAQKYKHEVQSLTTEMDDLKQTMKEMEENQKEEINNLKDEIAHEKQKYKDLEDVNMDLDAEIEYYRTMLQKVEEIRINSPPPKLPLEENSEESESDSDS